jgi:hypothetical protein
MSTTNLATAKRTARRSERLGRASSHRRAPGKGTPAQARTVGPMAEADIADLGAAVAEEGLRAHRDRVLELASQATPFAPVAAGVLASESEPDVARLRAFAVVASALVRKKTTSTEHHHGTVSVT